MVLSGAGPCLIAFSAAHRKVENEIAAEMVQTFKKFDVQSSALILDLDTRGAIVEVRN